MDFSFDDENLKLRDMCRSFAQKEIAPHAGRWSEEHHMPTTIFKHMGELGLMGMLVSEQWGGVDAGFVNYVTAMREIGMADQSVASSWNAHSTIGSLPLARFGTDSQKEKWLRPLATGTHIGAFGLTEPSSGSDAASIKTRARRDAGGWVIDGSKMFITNAGTDISLGVTLLAVTGEDNGRRQFGTFFVPTGTEGYTLGAPLKKLGWNASDTRELVFDSCWVSDDHVIGDESRGLRQFLEVLDPGRISVAALALSLAEAALKLAVKQVKEREQFGKPIGQFQAVGHKIADMALAVETARLLVYRAAWLADEGQDFREAAAMAKLHASEVANRVASDSLQLHGGYGYMRESEISRFYADAKILEIGEGTSEIQRNVISKLILA
jgi:short/branched chain acyl-CoA dehydrogenase